MTGERSVSANVRPVAYYVLGRVLVWLVTELLKRL